jgi:hypothetical protein
MAQSLAAIVVKFDAKDPTAFVMIVGVGDSVAFDSVKPTWQVDPSIQDRCYIGMSAPMFWQELCHAARPLCIQKGFDTTCGHADAVSKMSCWCSMRLLAES